MTIPAGMICALCAADGGDVRRFAVTAVGPLAVCGLHVDPALAKLGYTAPALDVASWLEQVDAKELQTAALERIEDYADQGGTGKAFLSVLIESAKAQAAG